MELKAQPTCTNMRHEPSSSPAPPAVLTALVLTSPINLTNVVVQPSASTGGPIAAAIPQSPEQVVISSDMEEAAT